MKKYTYYDDSEERVKRKYIEKYGLDPKYVSFTPYRVCPLGAHVDHNLGKVTGFALDKGIYLAYDISTDGINEITSLQFPSVSKWHVLLTPPEKEGKWDDYLKGVNLSLSKRYPLKYGIKGVVSGELPIGGLSSSAAVCIMFLNALAKANDIKLSEEEIITISKEAENNYMKVSCGKLDQSCIVYSKKNSLLYLDLKDNSKTIINNKENMKPFEIGVFFSGLERNLTSTKYNMRTDELRVAAYILKAYSNIEYGKVSETNMIDVPYEIYLEYKDRLPESIRKRAEHFYSEIKRVEEGVLAYQNADIEYFGKLMNESGCSSINNWEVGSKELIKLYEILKNTKGVYGARFSGAGFKGSSIALIDPEYSEEILEKVSEEYTKSFPELKKKYKGFICHSANGVEL